MAARYVAIIMDGNARWATERGMHVLEGHREGARALKRTVRNAVRLDVKELTVYAFSTENWTRPRAEVEGLMAMFAELIETETPELGEEGVRMRFIGRRDGVSDDLRDRMDWAERETAANDRMTLFVAFNYGGRAEIVDAARRFGGGDEEDFAKLLYAPEMSDPDLLIRTSGEHRLSNYLLWQSAYSELVFSDALWPDFDHDQLAAALDEYASRERRFGAR
jgi:undecaprenyl diphosphate synthase